MRKTKKASTLFMQTGPGGPGYTSERGRRCPCAHLPGAPLRPVGGGDLERSVPTSKQYMYQLVEAAVFMNEKWLWRSVDVRRQLSI